MTAEIPSKSFFGRVDGGRLKVTKREEFQRLLDQMNGQEIEITITPRLSKSEQMRRYYWGVLIKKWSAASGFSPKEAHEWFKTAFGEDEVLGHPPSTAKMDHDLYRNYIDYCLRKAAEMGCVIPDPR